VILLLESGVSIGLRRHGAERCFLVPRRELPRRRRKEDDGRQDGDWEGDVTVLVKEHLKGWSGSSTTAI
jgi:hypothetical protein